MVGGSKRLTSATNKTRPSSAKDKVSAGQDYGEGLVGSKIKVWWPMDRKFYQGVVDSFVSSTKKHRVLYDDGDVENLDMKKERWELIEEDDSEADEDESADKSSEGTPQPNAKSRSGKLSDDSEEEREKPKSGVKKAEKSKEVEKKSSKPEAEKNGKMGDIGGKIVAAASRMSGRFQSKQNGHEKETPKAMKSSKEVKNSKQKRPSSSSGAANAEVKKPRTSLKKSKSNYSDGEKGGEGDDTSDDESKPKALESSKKVSKNRKQKKLPSLSGPVNAKLKKPRTSSKKIKGNHSNGEEGGDDNGEEGGDDDDTSDDESKPLVSLLKKSPEAGDAIMENLKGKKEKEAGEESSGNEKEVEEESS